MGSSKVQGFDYFVYDMPFCIPAFCFQALGGETKMPFSLMLQMWGEFRTVDMQYGLGKQEMTAFTDALPKGVEVLVWIY